MAFTYNTVANEVAYLFGNILGATVATAQTNYAATQSNTTLKGPDFISGAIQDAILDTQMELVEAISLNPYHPERFRYSDVVFSVPSGGGLPATGTNSGLRILGIPSAITDNVNLIPLIPAPLAKIRAFNRYTSAGQIYNGKNEYWYNWDGRNIYHTRALVTIGVVAFDRPTFTAGLNVNLGDYLQTALIMGAVRRLAPKEGMYLSLYDRANTIFAEAVANIRGYNSELYGGQSLAAPSMT